MRLIVHSWSIYLWTSPCFSKSLLISSYLCLRASNISIFPNLIIIEFSNIYLETYEFHNISLVIFVPARRSIGFWTVTQYYTSRSHLEKTNFNTLKFRCVLKNSTKKRSRILQRNENQFALNSKSTNLTELWFNFNPEVERLKNTEDPACLME